VHTIFIEATNAPYSTSLSCFHQWHSSSPSYIIFLLPWRYTYCLFKRECLKISSNQWSKTKFIFAKIQFVDGHHCLNKCDIVCFLKYCLHFEKRVKNLFRLLAALITHKIKAKLVAPKICTTWEQGIKALKLSCNILRPFKPILQQTESWKWSGREVVKIKDAFRTFALAKWDFTLGTLQGF